ncbi:MAG: DUF998 domain-containing protein [Flavobacterium sp.]|nr:DUF998 domain-containing protein [Flavobacterium sp.]
MRNISVFWVGLLGVIFFVVPSVLGGFQFDNYDPISQFISETYAVDAPYGNLLRFLGYIPSGILLTIFCFTVIKKFPQSGLIKIGFWGLGVFYGITTIIVGLFPCDKGCNKEFINPSISQIIHNLTGLLTYLIVPISIIIIGVGLQQLKKYDALSKTAILCGLISVIFIGLLLSNPLTDYAGLYQRIVEGTFLIWIISCSFFVKNNNQ